MSKILNFLFPVLFAGTIFSSSAQTICACVYPYPQPERQYICNGNEICPHVIIDEQKLNSFIGPITPEQVGNALNIEFRYLGTCERYQIMTFPAGQFDQNGPDTRLWSGYDRSGQMLNDDSGIDYNFSREVETPCNPSEKLRLSIDFYPNQLNKKPFYIFVTKKINVGGNVPTPAGW